MNKKIRLIILAISILFSTSVLRAQVTTKEIIDEFFKKYEKSPQSAVDYAFGTNKWMVDRKKDAIDNVKNQLASFIEISW